MRTVFLALSLIVLTAAAAFWMGRLRASNPASHWERLPPNLGCQYHPNREVAHVSAAATETPEAIAPAGSTTRAEAPARAGTIKATAKSEAATAGIAKPSNRTGDILAVAKREAAGNVSRIGRPVGPDGIGFEPLPR